MSILRLLGVILWSILIPLNASAESPLPNGVKLVTKAHFNDTAYLETTSLKRHTELYPYRIGYHQRNRYFTYEGMIVGRNIREYIPRGSTVVILYSEGGPRTEIDSPGDLWRNLRIIADGPTFSSPAWLLLLTHQRGLGSCFTERAHVTFHGNVSYSRPGTLVSGGNEFMLRQIHKGLAARMRPALQSAAHGYQYTASHEELLEFYPNLRCP